jgi:hypothetical protein
MDIDARVEALEKNLRRQRWLSLTSACLALAVLAAWSLWPAPKTIVAERFNIRDSSGKLRSGWGWSMEANNSKWCTKMEKEKSNWDLWKTMGQGYLLPMAKIKEALGKFSSAFKKNIQEFS